MVAPHPDDFDAIALALRHLHEQGHALHVAVLTTGASGVEDGFEGACGDDAKAALREAEQRASCALFGLAPERLRFLRMWGGGSDDVAPLRLAGWRNSLSTCCSCRTATTATGRTSAPSRRRRHWPPNSVCRAGLA
ncbi:hypothetical protein HK414_26835 [Ramlibacter terrae]|uniref:PIG-L family deacetylase n=1 Tax=Ramlibacter terrae TaxID=2732511 RepID=A0ABX6P887_9BURK|nr:hypothetical protein HK414_26835 [Ramlibacter terrae]